MSEEKPVKIRCVKPEIRVLGIDDGIFVPRREGLVDVVGVVFRGGYWLDGVMRTTVEVDGLDATDKIASMVTSSPHYDQIRVVMLNGVTFAGFNVVDIKKLSRKLRLPVIAVVREKPNFEEIRSALRNLPEYEKRWEAVESARDLIEVRTRKGEEPVYMQVAGILHRDAEKILRSTSTRSNLPEALRVAHIIASGLARSKENI